MRKILLALLVLGVTACSSFAQTSTSKSDEGKFSIGVDPGLPVGTTSDFSSFAIGGDLKYDFPISTGTYFNISAGYTVFTGKDGFGSSNFIPLKAGLKYYFDGKNFFGEGQIGGVFSTQSGGGTAFVYAPGIGYTLDGGFEIGLRYEGWAKNGTVSQIAFRLGINL